MMTSTFYYFGYGSNMLAKRIHMQNPGAKRVGIGKLEDYRLDFHKFSNRWRGAPATIVPSPGDIAYGAIWEFDICHIKDLDDQESVNENIYCPKSLPVYCLNLQKPFECRYYHLVDQPTTHLKSFSIGSVPCNRHPSKTYLKTLVKGAIESGIPGDYITWLKSIQHNSNTVECFEKVLELQTVEL